MVSVQLIYPPSKKWTMYNSVLHKWPDIPYCRVNYFVSQYVGPFSFFYLSLGASTLLLCWWLEPTTSVLEVEGRGRLPSEQPLLFNKPVLTIVSQEKRKNMITSNPMWTYFFLIKFLTRNYDKVTFLKRSISQWKHSCRFRKLITTSF